MSDASIKLISSVRPIDSNIITETQLPVQVESAATPKQKEKPQVQAERVPDQNSSLSNISIHFRVDDKTNDVTVFLVDRISKKVLRSIPASEMQKLQAGDLLKLTA
jgi:uncharacterized FlaG/YvyC family protein